MLKGFILKMAWKVKPNGIIEEDEEED